MDDSVFLFFYNLAWKNNFLDSTFRFVTDILPYVLALTAFTVWLFWRVNWLKKIKVAAILAIAGAGAYLVVFEIFHQIWPRSRPFEHFYDVLPLVPEDGFSFPSKHAVLTFLLATYCYKFNKKLGTLLFFGAFLVSISRIIVGVHYPSDVLFGAVFGVLMGWLGAFVAHKIIK